MSVTPEMGEGTTQYADNSLRWRRLWHVAWARGLSVTLGLMNLINLAHGAFATPAASTVVLVNIWRTVLSVAPLAFLVAPRSASARFMFTSIISRIWQVLVHHRPGVHGTDFVMSTTQVFAPDVLQGQFDFFGVGVGRYRMLIIVVCGVLAIGLQFILTHTRFGSRLRAAVDDQRVARGLGINVNGIFALTFAFGSGLAGLGGALGTEILGLDPTFPLKYMIYFLIVVTVGGTSSITGPFLASLLLGIGDVAGKYYVPKLGSFVIYTIMIVVLIWRPQGLFSRGSAK